MTTSIGYWDTSLLTISQAAKLLNVHPDTLRRWERQGVLSTVRVGSRKDRRYRHEDILAMTQQETAITIPQLQPTSNKNQMKKIQAGLQQSSWVFFDVGYTLMALFPSRGDMYAEIAYGHGYNLNPLLIQQNFNKLEEEWNKQKILSHPVIHAFQPTVSEHYAQFNAEILMRSGIPRNDKALAFTIGKEVFDTVFTDYNRWRIFTNVEKFLEKLKKQGKKLAVIENWDNRLTNFMKKWRLDSYFEFILPGGGLNLRKPDSRIFELALQKAHAKPETTIHIGDVYVDDILGAKKAGITPLLFDVTRRFIKEDCLKFYTYQELIDVMK